MIQSYFLGLLENAFMPENSALVVLAFLAGAGGLVASVLVAGFAAVTGRRRLLAWTGAAAGIGLAGYAGAILFFSWGSEERILKPGEKKYFCEIDCHVAYSLENVSRVKTVGGLENPLSASGEFAVVTIRTWFDERTIASRRGDAPLTPNPRSLLVTDDSGRRYRRSPAAERALRAAGVRSTPMTRALRPGESYTTVAVFDLPAGIVRPRLLLTDDDPVSLVLIGHENSFFHKKISFGLAPATASRP